MDPESHRRTSSSSELFICFTSRHSSSSKSIPTPGQNSLSSSLSRRLCSSGSVKGGAQMFTPTGKKKGDNPEPSSPKVTCIGQVRVKTKKQRSRSKRRGEVSFRRVEHASAAAPEGIGRSHFSQQRSHRWVHLPVTICEALRSFGAEFSCLLPCRSSCMSAAREREKPVGSGGRIEESGTTTSCGAVFERWLVALQDGDGKGREIELMVAEHEPPESCRRHVFEDINIEAEGFEGEEKSSACVPPKNALLLMRCRSDPVKMAALSNHFLDNGHKEQMPTRVQLETEHNTNVEEHENGVAELKSRHWVTQETHQEQYPEPESEKHLNLTVRELNLENEETELVTSEPALAAKAPQFVLEIQNQEIEDTTASESESESKSEDGSEEEEEEESETKAGVSAEMAVVTEELAEGETETTTRERSEPEEPGPKSTEESQNQKALPDCLMLMMYEPKLSMEVSKETWVCTTDFIRWLPERPPVKGVIKTDVQDEPKKRTCTDSGTVAPQRSKQLQPPRSSCSFPEPAPASCDPLVLTRCKSEPRSAAKLEGTRTRRSAFNEVLKCV